MAAATAVCTVSSYQWAFNSLGQSPCLIGAYLGGACNAGQFTVTPLAAGNVYLGPTLATANECRCSSVFYSVISACAACQGREYLDWSNYDTNCSTVYAGVFTPPIPAGTRVPHYAYLNPTVDNTFNITAAQESLNAPESTAVATPTGPAGAGSTAKSSSSSKAGPIAGGVVGGLVAIGLIAALIFWLTRRNRSKIAPSAEATNTYAAVPPNAQTPMSYNTAAPSFPLPSPKLYDPSDPSTYPTSDMTHGGFAPPGQGIYPDAGSTYSGPGAPVPGGGFNPALQPNNTGGSYPAPGGNYPVSNGGYPNGSYPVPPAAPGGRYTGAPEL